jgi:hypothetical protein
MRARCNPPERDREVEEALAGGSAAEVDPDALRADRHLRQPRFRKVLEVLAQRQQAVSTRELMDATGLSRTSVIEVLQDLTRRRPALAGAVPLDDPAYRRHPGGTKLHRHTRAGVQADAVLRAAPRGEVDPEAEEARFHARRAAAPPGGPKWQAAGRDVRVEEQSSGPVVLLQAVDRSPGLDEPVVVGQLYLHRSSGDDRTFGGRAPQSYASVTNLWTSPSDEDAPIVVRLLHERAAAIAASWGLPLGSGVELTVPHDAWWGYQAAKGRAQLGSYRGRGGYAARRWFLGYPPPASLENPPGDPRDRALRAIEGYLRPLSPRDPTEPQRGPGRPSGSGLNAEDVRLLADVDEACREDALLGYAVGLRRARVAVSEALPARTAPPPPSPLERATLTAPFGAGVVLRPGSKKRPTPGVVTRARFAAVRAKFLDALASGATVPEASRAAGLSSPLFFQDLAAEDEQVRRAMEKAFRRTDPERRSNPDDRLRTAERALAAAPDDRGAWVALWRERARAGRLHDHGATPRGRLELDAWRHPTQGLTDAAGAPAVRVHDGPGEQTVPLADAPASLLWELAGKRDPMTTPAAGDVFVRHQAGSLRPLSFIEVVSVVLARGRRTSIVGYYAASGDHADRGQDTDVDFFVDLVRHTGYRPFLIAELRASGLSTPYPGWKAPSAIYAENRAAFREQGRRRPNPDDRLRRRARGAGDDPLEHQAAANEALRAGRFDVAVPHLLAAGSEAACALVSPMDLGGPRDAMVLELGRELVRRGWLPNLPLTDGAPGAERGPPGWRVSSGGTPVPPPGVELYQYWRGMSGSPGLDRAEPQVALAGSFGRARRWKFHAQYGFSSMFRIPGNGPLNQGATFHFAILPAGRNVTDAARRHADAVASDPVALRALAPRGWFTRRWHGAEATTMPAALGGHGVRAGFDAGQPSNATHHYAMAVLAAGSPHHHTYADPDVSADARYGWFLSQGRVGWIPGEQVPARGVSPPEVRAWLFRPERLEAIRALFYGDLWLAGLMIPPELVRYDPETLAARSS